jgi:hypothetical protein
LLLLGLLGAGEHQGRGAADADEFVAKIRSALENKDRDALARLSYWEGVDGKQRRLLEKRQEPIFDHPVHTIELKPKPAGYKDEYVSDGMRYRLNLPMEGMVRIEFVGNLDTDQSRLFPYGIHDGRYYIARVAEAGPAEERDEEKQLMISIMTPSGPDPVDYVVSCSYDAPDGEERREKYEGHGASQKVLWGTRINWCRLWNRSEEGWVRLVLKADLETYFESSAAEPGHTVVYP